jgi:hypothetical protein
MKRVVLFSFLFGAVVIPLGAQETAYKALRVLGRQRGEKALNQIVAIQGRNGSPQPVTWFVQLDDPAARGGIRELEVTNLQVAGERAPLRADNQGAGPIDLTRLNVDSDAAFQAAEQEARRHQVGFDTVDYSLVAGAGQIPTWRLELKDAHSSKVGVVRVAADSGAVVGGSEWAPAAYADQSRESSVPAASGQPSGYANGNPLPSYQPRPSPERAESGQGQVESSSGQTIGERARNVGQSVGDHAQQYGQTVAHFGVGVWGKTERAARRVGGWFQRQFTGRDTLSPPADQGNQSSPGDAYNQPVQPTDAYGRRDQPQQRPDD